MKTPKKSLAALLAMTLTVGLTACSGETDSQSAQSASSQPAQSASSSHTQEESGFPFTLTTKDGQEVTFTHVPETIISCNPNAGDELMALGLGDKIIATAYNNTQVNPQWREEYEAIPTVAESYISLETILSLEPDFVYGRSSSFSEKNNTTHDTLSGYGIMSLSSIEGYTVGADVDVVYQDFYDLGRIFQVEDRAEEIVSAMKEQIAAVEDVLGQIQAQDLLRVLVFNKCDLLDEEHFAALKARHPQAQFASAATGEGVGALVDHIARVASAQDEHLDVLIPYSRGDLVSIAHERCHILSETHEEAGTRIVMLAGPSYAGLFRPFVHGGE